MNSASKIPIWKPISPYRGSSPPALQKAKKASKVPKSDSQRMNESGPYIKGLIPHITMISSQGYSNVSKPYRNRFKSQYERCYNDLVNIHNKPIKKWNIL